MARSWLRGEDAVGDADAHHEVVGGQAFAALAAGGADAVALRVDAPPLEVECRPTRAPRWSGRRAQMRALRQRLPRDSSRASGVRRAGPWFLSWNSFGHIFLFEVKKQKARDSLGCIAGSQETLEFDTGLYRPRSPVRAKRHTAATTEVTLHPRIIELSPAKIKCRPGFHRRSRPASAPLGALPF